MDTFVVASIAATVAVVLLARRFRGKMFSRFVAVLLTIHTAVAVGLYEGTGRWWPVFVYLHVVSYVHFASLIWAKLRPLPWRILVSIPAHYFVASTFFAIPWAIARAIGFEPWGLYVPFVLGGFGLVEAFLRRGGDVHLDLLDDREHVDGLVRHRARAPNSDRPLRIMQITDPHLGAFMSAARLRRITERALARDPDLVVLTGDFITMESQASADPLAFGLEPLKRLEGRVFACLGNHDYEALPVVREGLARAGVKLLVDEEATVETEAGKIQIVGMDFRWRERREHLSAVVRRIPRREDHLRLVLLHDPTAFAALPEGEGDLVLSGHTHGGQLGLVSVGLPVTFLSLFTSVPDQGLWARGKDRLYVHRGTGHYGFPLRLGVPRDERLLLVHR